MVSDSLTGAGRTGRSVTGLGGGKGEEQVQPVDAAGYLVLERASVLFGHGPDIRQPDPVCRRSGQLWVAAVFHDQQEQIPFLSPLDADVGILRLP